MGTDGDLRKLKLSKAKALLRNFGVPEDEVRVTSSRSLIVYDRFCSLREMSKNLLHSGRS